MPDPHDDPFDLLAWAKTIAPLLPGGPDGESWTVEIDPDEEHCRRDVYFRRADLPPGATLAAYYYRGTYFNRDRKVDIHGLYPGDRRTGLLNVGCWSEFPCRSERPKSIRVSPRRTPKAQANDIARRFLTPYLVAYQAGLDKHREKSAERAEARAQAEHLARLMGAEINDHRQSSDRWNLYRYIVGPDDRARGTLKVEISDHGSGKIELVLAPTPTIVALIEAMMPVIDRMASDPAGVFDSPPAQVLADHRAMLEAAEAADDDDDDELLPVRCDACAAITDNVSPDGPILCDDCLADDDESDDDPHDARRPDPEYRDESDDDPDGEDFDPYDGRSLPSLDDVMTGGVATADPGPRRSRPTAPSPRTREWVRHWSGRFGQCN
ncbi:hypothetical protein AB1L88_15500 [Tautonia sp. JC769]|uniref:hypothetical protein n=1 Tax=Tautonia sp. JC769 TaxID=3232135 RepID=UPI00345AA1D6